VTGDFVTFSGVTGTYAALLNGEFQITFVTINSYTITVASAIPAGATGGSTVSAQYQINVGPAFVGAVNGWGAGTWGAGTWGNGGTSVSSLRLWNQINYGEDLVFGPRSGGLYYWDATNGVTTRGVALNTLGGTVTFTAASPTVVTATILLTEGAAIQFNTTGSMPSGVSAATTYYVYDVDGLTFKLLDSAGAVVNAGTTGSNVYISDLVDVPVVQNVLTVSDTSRFIIVFGTNDYGSTDMDPMLIRWSNQDDPYNWTPNATNQAGSIRLSHGSEIITQVQTRQEIVVFTDTSAYSLQYLGPPYVWQSQLLGDNISIVSPNSVIVASGVVYWMGVDKFYKYDGRVQTLRCDLRKFIYNDINTDQSAQIFSGTNEGFNEVWWFYCTANSTVVNRYVVYNYIEDIWYYGELSRTAWLDSPYQRGPIATTYINNMVVHETGNDNNETGTPQPIEAYINSAQFDLDDGHNFSFVWRVLPDITFNGSTGSSPNATMYLKPMKNSGSGYTTPPSVGGYANKEIVRTATLPIEEFTGQIYTRVRGRQLTIELRSTDLGVAWQLGSPRLDVRPDGRR